MVLYEMMTGKCCFQGPTKADVHQSILYAPVPFVDSMSKEAMSLILLLLKRDPTRRLGAGAMVLLSPSSSPLLSSPISFFIIFAPPALSSPFLVFICASALRTFCTTREMHDYLVLSYPSSSLFFLPCQQGTQEIKEHPFFTGIDWKKILHKEIEPPFKPHLVGTMDLKYFDPSVTETNPDVRDLTGSPRLDTFDEVLHPSPPSFSSFTLLPLYSFASPLHPLTLH